MVRLVHYFSGYEGMGGVHSLLRLHERMDREHGLDSRFIIGWEKQRRAQTEPRVYFLGINGLSNIRLHRHRFRLAIERIRPQIVVYHTPASMEYLADLDDAERRVVVLHTQPPQLRESMRLCIGLLDGLLAVSEPLHDAFAVEHPEWSPERIGYLPLPIEPWNTESRVNAGRSIKLGYAGRLVRLMKRADRLVALATSLRRLPHPVSLQIAGAGELDPWLRRRLAGQGNVEFLGELRGREYWNAIASWDLMINCSDQEAGPLTLLEGMAVGCLPICPDLPCQVKRLARAVAEELVYPPGDLERVVETIRWFGGLSPARREELRSTARLATAPHRPEYYLSSFVRFVKKIQFAGRVSSNEVPGRWAGLDDVSFLWQYKLFKLQAICRRWKALLRPLKQSGLPSLPARSTSEVHPA